MELKKSSVSIKLYELAEQIEKYRRAPTKVLETQFDEEDPYVECVAIVGKRPTTAERATQDQVLRASNARMITYDVLVQAALDFQFGLAQPLARTSGATL